MINKSVQSNRSLISGQLHRVLVSRQSLKDDNDAMKRKNSLKFPLKEQMNFQKTINNFNSRNSMDNIDNHFKVGAHQKIKSPIVVVPNRKLFASSKNSKKSQVSISQEPCPINKKTIECGYRIVVNKKSSRIPTLTLEEEPQSNKKVYLQKDPETFTDWVEKIYGKQWFV